MEPTANELVRAIADEAGKELDSAVDMIQHCLNQLSDEQIWWRPSEQMNSIANLILHACGNLRQWIVAGVGGALDVRNRPQEFAERGPISKDQLLQHSTAAVTEAKAALQLVPISELLRVRPVQCFEVTGLGAIFHSIPHFRGHTQEIVHMTRCLLGKSYQIAFEPPEPTTS